MPKKTICFWDVYCIVLSPLHTHAHTHTHRIESFEQTCDTRLLDATSSASNVCLICRILLPWSNSSNEPVGWAGGNGNHAGNQSLPAFLKAVVGKGWPGHDPSSSTDRGQM